MVEHDERFVPSEHRIAEVNVGAFFHLARVARLTSVDHRDSFGIALDGKRYGIVGVGFFHGDRRHNQVLMRVYGSRLVGLGTCHHDAVRSYFVDMNI